MLPLAFLLPQASLPAVKLAFLSDPHISFHPEQTNRGFSPREHFTQVIREIIAYRPEQVFITGDCAFRMGTAASYAAFEELSRPLREAGLEPILMAGNHDNPLHFPLAADRSARVLKIGPARFLLLNTTLALSVVPGAIGRRNLAEVDRLAREFAPEPIIVIGHHQPEDARRTDVKHGIGLADTPEWLSLLDRHQNLRAYLSGHSHSWHVSETEGGTALVNLPATSFFFDSTRPLGWVAAELTGEALRLELRSLGGSHPEEGNSVRVLLNP